MTLRHRGGDGESRVVDELGDRVHGDDAVDNGGGGYGDDKDLGDHFS